MASMSFSFLYIWSLKFPLWHQDQLCLKLGHGFIFGQEVGGSREGGGERGEIPALKGRDRGSLPEHK